MSAAGANENGVILVTGQSGVAVKKCIKTLAGKEPISVDDEASNKSKMPFSEFIYQPQYVQFRYWREGFAQAVQKLSPSEFLTFHATYYHQKKRELFSPVDFNVIQRLKEKVRMIIVFVDDIYDVYRRLMDENQMYHYMLDKKRIQPLDAIFYSVFNIISLLNWREMEVSLSRTIANFLGTKLFVVSTKHPDFMVKRLIQGSIENLKIYYLSHPITTIREESAEFLTSFVGKLETFIEKILDHENKNIVLFFPTSIDELIIKREKLDKDKYHYYPELSQRWGHPYKDQLLSPRLPPGVEDKNPLNPLEYKLSQDKNEPLNLAVSHILSLLWKYIYGKQTISRDYTLVDQSDNGVIAVRPLLEGKFHGGVKGELEYNFQLMGKQENREAFIFSTEEDLNRSAIMRLFNELETRLVDPPSSLSAARTKWKDKNEQIWKEDQNIIQQKLEKEVLGTYDFKSSKERSDWESDYWGAEIGRKKRVFKEIFQSVNIDEICMLIGESENLHGVKIKGTERLSYETWPQNTFWPNLYDWVDK